MVRPGLYANSHSEKSEVGASRPFCTASPFSPQKAIIRDKGRSVDVQAWAVQLVVGTSPMTVGPERVPLQAKTRPTCSRIKPDDSGTRAGTPTSDLYTFMRRLIWVFESIRHLTTPGGEGWGNIFFFTYYRKYEQYTKDKEKNLQQ